MSESRIFTSQCGQYGDRHIINALTIDIEDYFQVEALGERFPRNTWSEQESRIQSNVDVLLSLFDSHDVKATFFTLGWIANNFPDLIRKIASMGHEIASHGYDHVRVDQQNIMEFREDTRKTKRLLEDLIGIEVKGYRAASFSIGPATPWATEVLADEGYHYSSSIYPIRHDLYGWPDGPRFAFNPLPGSTFLEIPISTLRFMGRNLPCGGGGYFRLLPYHVSRWAIARVNRRDLVPCIFYLHPWELDSTQPRVKNLPMRAKVRHYLNLNRTTSRLGNLLRDFSWGRVDEIFLRSVSLAA